MKVAFEIARQVWARGRLVRVWPFGKTDLARSTKCLEKGEPNRRLIADKVIDGVVYTLHATKGWRRHRAAA